MLREKDFRRPGSPLMRVAVAAAVLGFLPLLFLTQTAPRLIDAAVYFDRSLIALLNRFAQRSWAFDTLIWGLSTDFVLQGSVLMALFWGAWFATGDTPTGQEKRVVMLSSLLALYAAVFVAVVVRTTALPFRPRPVTDPAIAFQVPYLPHGTVLSPTSTAFPSGHAIYLFALVAALWSISAALGLFGALHAFFVGCVPRIYLGLHCPTDILVGAVFGIVTVAAVNTVLPRELDPAATVGMVGATARGIL